MGGEVGLDDGEDLEDCAGLEEALEDAEGLDGEEGEVEVEVGVVEEECRDGEEDEEGEGSVGGGPQEEVPLELAGVLGGGEAYRKGLPFVEEQEVEVRVEQDRERLGDDVSAEEEARVQGE